MEYDVWDAVSSPPKLRDYARLHCILYNDLSFEALLRDPCTQRWRVFPKHHLFLHVVEETPGNPREAWNYLDENEIGKAAETAEGLHRTTIATVLIDKYRL